MSPEDAYDSSLKHYIGDRVLVGTMTCMGLFLEALAAFGNTVPTVLSNPDVVTAPERVGAAALGALTLSAVALAVRTGMGRKPVPPVSAAAPEDTNAEIIGPEQDAHSVDTTDTPTEE